MKVGTRVEAVVDIADDFRAIAKGSKGTAYSDSRLCPTLGILPNGDGKWIDEDKVLVLFDKTDGLTVNRLVLVAVGKLKEINE